MMVCLLDAEVADGVWLFRFPGVYRPQPDTWLLAGALRRAAIKPGGRVLDIGTGTGALALVALDTGAGEVTAIEASIPAAWSARVNAALHRKPVRVRRTSLSAFRPDHPYDVIVANPPYIPSQSCAVGKGRALAWDAGPNGRTMIDLLCDLAGSLLAPGGMLLLVHSSICGTRQTLRQLGTAHLKAAVVARRTVPFGPVLRRRALRLEEAGLIEPGQSAEELVVIRADRVDSA